MATDVQSGIVLHPPSKSRPSPVHGDAPPPAPDEALARVANRTALLTFLTAAMTIAALTALPSLLSPGTPLSGRLLSAAAVASAVFAFLAVRRSRARLEAARREGPAGG